MVLHKLFLFSLLALLPLQAATNSKQELNDQLYEAVRKGDVAAVTAALDRGAVATDNRALKTGIERPAF